MRKLFFGVIIASISSVVCAHTVNEIGDHVSRGAHAIIGAPLGAEEIKTIINRSPETVSVVCKGFSPKACQDFSTAGAGLILDSSYPYNDLLDLLNLAKNPGRITVRCAGMSIYDCWKFARSGTKVHVDASTDYYDTL